MKMPSPLFYRLLELLIARGLWLLLVACVFSPVSQAAGASTGTHAKGSPLAALDAAVTQWVAGTMKVAAKEVALAPLDERMKIQACDKDLLIDQPFPNPESVRVRCSQPIWQVYVRVSVSGKAPVPQVAAKPEKKPLPEKLPVLASAPVVEPPKMPEKRWVLVAKVPLQRGMKLNAAHVERVEVDTTGMPVNVLEETSQVMYAEVVRDVRSGVPLRSHDIRPSVLVKRGQTVLLSVGQAQGFQISARVEAMQDGHFGDQIRLKNRDSGRELSGRVQGPNQVTGL